jgi:hypothetical protein
MISLLRFVTEGIAWLLIAASPLLIGAGLGLFLYVQFPGTPMLVTGLALATIGLGFGMWWATRIWKRRGTVDFIARVVASPELDKA